mmetsp:Transcript_71818/g.208067  ORF Transcript_71818/g.208067 Transcript_71818/m.208067 type:complete len:246 (-) Transcript_71818:1367-2104(-)
MREANGGHDIAQSSSGVALEVFLLVHAHSVGPHCQLLDGHHHLSDSLADVVQLGPDLDADDRDFAQHAAGHLFDCPHQVALRRQSFVFVDRINALVVGVVDEDKFGRPLVLVVGLLLLQGLFLLLPPVQHLVQLRGSALNEPPHPPARLSHKLLHRLFRVIVVFLVALLLLRSEHRIGNDGEEHIRADEEEDDVENQDQEGAELRHDVVRLQELHVANIGAAQVDDCAAERGKLEDGAPEADVVR